MCLEYDNHVCDQENDDVVEDILIQIVSKIESKDEKKHRPKTKTSKTFGENCNACQIHNKHMIASNQSRQAYIDDASNVNNNATSFFSVDLQKVIMLPRLPGVKTVAFTKRIIAYNLICAPLGNKKKVSQKTMRTYAATWHEAEGGRSASEIASGYKYFIEHHRDVANFIFWADNCSVQNKNWHLFTLFTTLVNCKNAPHLKNITLKYFERGHTFMSADAYHHLEEKDM